ncbi:DUF4192 family protein (plasmid) [Rhodococcus qingshengii]|uniref:DUF4192 family protein n=1 Tax=Rhodococcus qingshengii TaxID=334542 RepID=UPI00311CC1C5
MQHIRLTTATDVLAAIPAILGFVPTDSVVMVALTEDGTLAFVARTDAQHAASVENFRIAMPQSNVAMVIWIVVGTGPIAAAGLDHIEQAQRELDTLGVRSVRTLVTASLEADAEWFDINGDESGRTADHTVSDTTMARMLQGRHTSSSRDEIESRYNEHETVADMDAAHAAAREQGEEFGPTTIAELAEIVRNIHVPSPELSARVGLCAATDPHHRDALIGVITINQAAAADAFTTIAAHLRGTYRVETLTIAGIASYVAADGVAAAIAFVAARRTDARPSNLLDLLETSLANGVNPEMIAELVAIGVEVARSMGVVLDTE